MGRNLPIVASVKEVYSGVTNHFFELIIAAWLWLLIGVTAMIWMGYSASASGLARMTLEDMRTASISPATVLQLVVALVIYIVAMAGAAVKWHRFVLLGEYAQDKDADITGHALRYVWTTIKIALVYIFLFGIAFVALGVLSGISKSAGAGAAAIAALLTVAIGAAILFLVIPVVLRLSLALPDVALGGRGSLREMFSKTPSNGMQLLGYSLLILLGIFTIAFVASFLVMFLLLLAVGADGVKNPTLQTQFIMQILQLPVNVFSMIVCVTMLSVAYREIIGLPAQNTPQPSD